MVFVSLFRHKNASNPEVFAIDVFLFRLQLFLEQRYFRVMVIVIF